MVKANDTELESEMNEKLSEAKRSNTAKIELAELSMLNDILEEAAIFRPDRKSQKKSEGGF